MVLANEKFIVQDGLTINTVEVFTSDGVLVGPSGNTLNASFIHANAAFDKANSANILAQAAYDYANTIYFNSFSKIDLGLVNETVTLINDMGTL